MNRRDFLKTAATVSLGVLPSVATLEQLVAQEVAKPVQGLSVPLRDIKDYVGRYILVNESSGMPDIYRSR